MAELSSAVVLSKASVLFFFFSWQNKKNKRHKEIKRNIYICNLITSSLKKKNLYVQNVNLTKKGRVYFCRSLGKNCARGWFI